MPLNSKKRRRAYIRSRVRDFSLYVAIAFALVGIAIESARFRVSHEAFIKWGGLVFITAILFGYFISNSEQFLRVSKFWTLTVTLLFAHLTVFALILTHVDEWKLIWFTGMAIEYPVFVFFRRRLL